VFEAHLKDERTLYMKHSVLMLLKNNNNKIVEHFLSHTKNNDEKG
jgi:hypothetical protein